MKIVALTGAGISAESGIATFRGVDGLWEGHRIEEVASPEGWHADKELVLDFYNKRRRNVIAAQPNQAHHILKELENQNHVQIITQNVDDLHERAGSNHILHLHGEIMKSRSTVDSDLIYPIPGSELDLGNTCEKGSQLRPHIVWFGEAVPAIEEAINLMSGADYVLVIGTSLQVYPAAGLVNYAPDTAQIIVINPNSTSINSSNVKYLNCNASEGMQIFKESLLRTE